MIQALPATFRGIRFRSRTEARWAVFMTELGVEWHYEHEGFALPSGNYLPDFWLPHLQTFLEIKGDETTVQEAPLFELAHFAKKRVVLFVGTPQQYLAGIPDYNQDIARAFFEKGNDYPYWWTICPHCGSVGIEFDGRSARVKHSNECSVLGTYADKNYNHDDARIVNAVETSRRWRSPEGG